MLGPCDHRFRCGERSDRHLGGTAISEEIRRPQGSRRVTMGQA